MLKCQLRHMKSNFTFTVTQCLLLFYISDLCVFSFHLKIITAKSPGACFLLNFLLFLIYDFKAVGGVSISTERASKHWQH